MEWLIKNLPTIICVTLAAFLLWAAYAFGCKNTEAEYELKLNQETIKHQAALADANEAARDKEHDYAAALAAQSDKHAEDDKRAKQQLDALQSDLLASRRRLSVPVARCVTPEPTGTDSAAAVGPEPEARGELDPTTAHDLVAIAADGDACVRQLNSLIDYYNDLVRLGGKPSR